MSKKQLKALLNRVFFVMQNMKNEKDEIRQLLNRIDSELRQQEEGEEELRCAREYYFSAMEKLMGK